MKWKHVNNVNNEVETTEVANKEEKIWTCLPFIKGVTDKIARILRQGNIKTIFKPTQKVEQILGNPKDKRPALSNPGIYRIPCSCGKEYIGLTRRSINTRLGEHERSVRLKHPELSSVAEHALTTVHTIQFEETSSLRTEGNMNILRHLEAIEISRRPVQKLINRQQDLSFINKIWFSIIRRQVSRANGGAQGSFQNKEDTMAAVNSD